MPHVLEVEDRADGRSSWEPVCGRSGVVVWTGLEVFVGLPGTFSGT
ncbi:MAG: hypothetical protein M3503_04405 [Actinomycetota bacterium]|nr:hypothetical protein [Actinomycetota bacterium]